MCVISLIVFTDKYQRTCYAFYTKMVFHYILIIQYQNKVTIHMGIQNDVQIQTIDNQLPVILLAIRLRSLDLKHLIPGNGPPELPIVLKV